MDGTPVFMFWNGTLSNLEILSIKSFLCNSHPVELYTYDVPQLAKQVSLVGLEIKDASTVIPKADFDEIFNKKTVNGRYTPMSWFADMFRYKILADRGGIWADTDIICVKHLDLPDTVLVSQKDDEYPVNNNFIKVKKGDPLITHAYKVSYDIYKSGQKRKFAQTGPRLLSTLLKKPEWSGYSINLVSSDHFNSVDWKEIDRITKPNECFEYLDNDDVYGFHLWNKVWCSDLKLSKNVFDYPDSLITHLYKKYW